MCNPNQLPQVNIAAFLLLAFGGNLIACQSEGTVSATPNQVLVTARVVPETVAPGEEAELVISVSIPPGFHIYGARNKTHPTTVKLHDVASFSAEPADVPRGSRRRKNGGETSFWLTGTQEIRQKIQVADSASGVIRIAGDVDFMMCDKNVCKPPRKIAFTAKLKLASKTNAKWTFAAPVRMEADGKPILIESPGYASPTWGDINGDGLPDLTVGQFSGGKIQFFLAKKDGTLGAGQWLKVDGKVGHVPDIW